MRLPLSRRTPPRRVTFVTRAGCSLCASAEPVVARLAGEAGVPLEVVDVDGDPQARAAWSDKVPVVLLDGREHSWWRVDEAELRAALRGRRSGRRPGPSL